MAQANDLLELEDVADPRPVPPPDRRRFVPEPPPVRLVAVRDVHRFAPAGAEVELDRFYRDLLRFERESTPDHYPAYRAERHRVVFDVVEPPVRRDDLRPVGVEIPHFFDVETYLIENDLPHERVTKLVAGQDGLLLKDPAGNWVALLHLREFR